MHAGKFTSNDSWTHCSAAAATAQAIHQRVRTEYLGYDDTWQAI